MVKLKAGRPSNKYLATFDKIKTEEFYSKIVETCIKAVLQKQHWIYITTARIFKFPRGFPMPGIVTRNDNDTKTCRFNSYTLLNWLESEGHTSITPKQIGTAFLNFSINMNKDFKLPYDDEEEVIS